MKAEGRRDPPGVPGPPPGFSLIELLICLALLGILVSIAVPLVAGTVARERLHAAGWETALLLREVRQRSVTERTAYGLRFIRSGGSWSYSLYRDGNDNGIRTADILSGKDLLVRGPEDPGRTYEGIRFGLPEGETPQIPPATGPIPAPSDPVKFGGSNIIGFSPAGSMSSGTLYLTDGRRVLAVVAFGATGRIRTFRFEPEEGWRRVP